MTVQLVGEASLAAPCSNVVWHSTRQSMIPFTCSPNGIFELLYGSKAAPDCLEVGRLANADSIPALVNVDKL